jgi:hypothetical protein
MIRFIRDREDGDTALVRTMSHGLQGGDWQCS